jgi:murein DD-endopeptidase MepM/ murein hydrolase activator NlpD
MLMGSVLVKLGDTVRQGQIIGRVGFSGDAIFPHVHYALVSGPNIRQSEGLPAYFSQFERLLGSKKVQVFRGTLDSGDLVQSTGKYEQVANPH